MLSIRIAVPLLILSQCLACNDHQEAVQNDIRRSPRNVLVSPYTSKPINKGWVPKDWLTGNFHLGQVSGVTLDDDGLVYVFHRSDRVWNANTFNNVNNTFLQADLGPIVNATILVFHSNGTLLNSRGKGMFYMPHGIFVDKYKNIWITDVALHQVMKLPPNSDSPLLTLGKPFIPGSDATHFCKPAAIAVLRETNDFFVADGYCNNRILKFDSNGTKLLEWGRSSATINNINHILGQYEFYIPHALTIVEDKNLICVADRQNGRVLCYHTNNGSFSLQIVNPHIIGPFIFSVSYSPANGGQFFLVNGVNSNSNNVQGFVVSHEGQIDSSFGLGYLQFPHDLAVTNDSQTIYVAELSPPRVAKFVLDADLAKKNSKKLSMLTVEKIHEEKGKLTGAILVTTSCLIFATAIIVAAFIYSRSNKAGTYDATELLLTNQDS